MNNIEALINKTEDRKVDQKGVSVAKIKYSLAYGIDELARSLIAGKSTIYATSSCKIQDIKDELRVTLRELSGLEDVENLMKNGDLILVNTLIEQNTDYFVETLKEMIDENYNRKLDLVIVNHLIRAESSEEEVSSFLKVIDEIARELSFDVLVTMK